MFHYPFDRITISYANTELQIKTIGHHLIKELLKDNLSSLASLSYPRGVPS